MTNEEWRYQHGVGPEPRGFHGSAIAADYQPAPRRDYTADEITDGVASALKARDFPAVISLLKMLALKDPGRAQTLYDVMKLAVGASDD